MIDEFVYVTVICDEDRTDLSLASEVPVNCLLPLIERYCKVQNRDLTGVDGVVLDKTLSLADQQIADGGYLYLCEPVARPPILRDRIERQDDALDKHLHSRTQVVWVLIGVSPGLIVALSLFGNLASRLTGCAIGVVAVLLLMVRSPSLVMRCGKTRQIAVLTERCRGVEVGLSLATVGCIAGLLSAGGRMAQSLGCVAAVLAIFGSRQFRDRYTQIGMIGAQLIGTAVMASFQRVGVLPIVVMIALSMVMHCSYQPRSVTCRIVDRLEMLSTIIVIPLMCGVVGLYQLMARVVL
ncbi:MAG: EsaB/YukD family protein [Antricoccus sp.]